MWCFLWLWALFLGVAVAMNITIDDPVILYTKTTVRWSRDENEPSIWDFHLVRDGKSDPGPIIAPNIKSQNKKYGSLNITLPTDKKLVRGLVGSGVSRAFKLVARENASGEVVGTSDSFSIRNSSNLTVSMPPSTVPSTPIQEPSSTIGPTSFPTTAIPSLAESSSGTTSSASSTGPSLQPPASALQKSSSKVPIIVGSVLGGCAFMFIAIGVGVLIKRRRRRTKTQSKIIFNRELMFQRRPSPYNSWTIGSLDLERGSLSNTPRALATKTTVGDGL